jgi:hypothetical protein
MLAFSQALWPRNPMRQMVLPGPGKPSHQPKTRGMNEEGPMRRIAPGLQILDMISPTRRVSTFPVSSVGSGTDRHLLSTQESTVKHLLVSIRHQGRALKRPGLRGRGAHAVPFPVANRLSVAFKKFPPISRPCRVGGTSYSGDPSLACTERRHCLPAA